MSRSIVASGEPSCANAGGSPQTSSVATHRDRKLFIGATG